MIPITPQPTTITTTTIKPTTTTTTTTPTTVTPTTTTPTTFTTPATPSTTTTTPTAQSTAKKTTAAPFNISQILNTALSEQRNELLKELSDVRIDPTTPSQITDMNNFPRTTLRPIEIYVDRPVTKPMTTAATTNSPIITSPQTTTEKNKISKIQHPKTKDDENIFLDELNHDKPPEEEQQHTALNEEGEHLHHMKNSTIKSAKTHSPVNHVYGDVNKEIGNIGDRQKNTQDFFTKVEKMQLQENMKLEKILSDKFQDIIKKVDTRIKNGTTTEEKQQPPTHSPVIITRPKITPTHATFQSHRTTARTKFIHQDVQHTQQSILNTNANGVEKLESVIANLTMTLENSNHKLATEPPVHSDSIIETLEGQVANLTESMEHMRQSEKHLMQASGQAIIPEKINALAHQQHSPTKSPGLTTHHIPKTG